MNATTDYREIPRLLRRVEGSSDLHQIVQTRSFQELLEALRGVDAFSDHLPEELPGDNPEQAAGLLRRLRTAYATPADQLFSPLRQLAELMAPEAANNWQKMAKATAVHPDRKQSVARLLRQHSDDQEVLDLLNQLEVQDPHAIYPTSTYRTSSGQVHSTSDGSYINAVMTTSTMTEIRIVDHVLDPDNPTLEDIYRPLGRCVCVIDTNVHEHYGEELKAYFATHDITLELLVYRAMEVDKGIHMVEALMADFKNIGVSRQEPVLIIGGGVITDTGGLACALYHRNTPYIMLATSIVSGVDAGPSPRTCCDGFGFKNLFGAYHAPVLTLTDRTFFKTLRAGWIRHGVAEIIKMAVVKDAELFELLEEVGLDLVTSQFGINTEDDQLRADSKRIIAMAMRSYVQAEYSNLYETHQCRPHAYGHTWSPGYEIPSGMLHGHAIACGMGFGAHLSYQQGWISSADRDRIMRLISDFELSLWHPILDRVELLHQAQQKMTEKRGGNLVAPLPKGAIGQCGYLNELSPEQLYQAMQEYKSLCQTFPRGGVGIEPHCEDVGLEDPSTVGQLTAESPLLARV